MNVLFETAIKDMHTSGITNKSIQKDGTGRVQLIKAVLNGNQSLSLLYEVESSHDDNKHFSVNGQLMAGLQHGYAVQLQFDNVSNIVPNDFATLPYSTQEQIIKQVFDKADVRVQCDCGSFYWQGMHQEDDKHNTSYLPFTGTPGKDIWLGRHNASGNAPGEQLCKHLWAVKESIDNDVPTIIKQIGGGGQSSMATQAEQPDEPLEQQEQPAGLPQEAKQGTPRETTINSEKAATTVSADIDEVQSAAERQEEPTMDTSDVEAKVVDGDSTAEKGPEQAEPPVEVPTKAVADADVDKVLEQPLDEVENQKATLTEKLLYRGSNGMPLFYRSGMKSNETSDKLFTGDNAEHSLAFAEGQTTSGDIKVFEEYDVPDADIEMMYDMRKDPLQLRDKHTHTKGTRTWTDMQEIERYLRNNGYIGYINTDHTMSMDGPYSRVLTAANEYVFYDKDRYKPIKTIESDDTGEFSIEELTELSKIPGLEFLDREIAERKAEKDDDAFVRLYGMTREQAGDMPSEEELMADLDNDDDDDREYNKNVYDGTDDKLPFKQRWDHWRKGYVDLQEAKKPTFYDDQNAKLILGKTKKGPEKLGALHPNSILANPGIYFFMTKHSAIKVIYNEPWGNDFYQCDVYNDTQHKLNREHLLALFDEYDITPYSQQVNDEEYNASRAYSGIFERADYYFYLRGDEPETMALWTALDLSDFKKNKYSKNDVLTAQLGLADYREAKILDEPIIVSKDMQDEDYMEARALLDKSLYESIFKKTKVKADDFMDWDSEQIDEFIESLQGKEDPNETRSYSDGGWSFSPNTPPGGPSPLNMTLKMLEEGYDEDAIKWIVSKSYIGVYEGQVRDYISYYKGRERMKETLLREGSLIGTCQDVGENPDLPYNDATEMEQDLGFYATFDENEDPRDSNWEEISEVKFQLKNSIPSTFFKKGHEYMFLKRKESDLYIAYDIDDDIHYFFE
jgi:hypothetical protein